MLSIKFVARTAMSIALMAGAAAFTSGSAYALPHFGIHRHAQTNPADDRVEFVLYNTSSLFRDIRIGGKVYTLMGHQHMSFKAPAGTQIYTETTGGLHRKGDLLLQVDRSMNSHTVSIS